MLSDSDREFLRTHRLCVVGFARKKGPPSLTPVYYVMDGDDLLISTTASRAKAKAVRRNPEVSVCVLGEQPPFPYLTLYGEGGIEEAGVVDLMLRIGSVMTGQPVNEAARPMVAERAEREGRVVLRVTPERAFPSAPRAQPRAQPRPAAG